MAANDANAWVWHDAPFRLENANRGGLDSKLDATLGPLHVTRVRTPITFPNGEAEILKDWSSNLIDSLHLAPSNLTFNREERETQQDSETFAEEQECPAIYHDRSSQDSRMLRECSYELHYLQSTARIQEER